MNNNTVPVSKLHVPCRHLGHGWQPLPQCNGIQSLQFDPVYLYAHVHTSGRTHNPWPLQLFTVLQHDKVIYNCKCNFEYPLINPFRFLAPKYFFSYLVFQSFDYERRAIRWSLRCLPIVRSPMKVIQDLFFFLNAKCAQMRQTSYRGFSRKTKRS